jgi:hypothetical protein
VRFVSRIALGAPIILCIFKLTLRKRATDVPGEEIGDRRKLRLDFIVEAPLFRGKVRKFPHLTASKYSLFDGERCFQFLNPEFRGEKDCMSRNAVCISA